MKIEFCVALPWKIISPFFIHFAHFQFYTCDPNIVLTTGTLTASNMGQESKGPL